LVDRKEHLDTIASILLLILCASWGLQQVAIKLIAADVSPVMQSAIRSIGATLIVSLWVVSRGGRIFVLDGTLWWGVAAGLLFGIEFLLIYWGLAYTNASRAVVFLYMSPFVVAIGSQLFVPGEKLNRYQFAGLGIAFSGILVVFGESLTLPTREMMFGDGLMIAAAIFWGATTVVIKAGPLSTIAPSRTLLYQLTVSIPILLLGSVALREPGIVSLSSLAIGSLLYQTVWVASTTFLAWFWLIRHYAAPKIASFTFLTPLFGVIAGWAVLDEPITPALLIALALVGSGVYLVNRQS